MANDILEGQRLKGNGKGRAIIREGESTSATLLVGMGSASASEPCGRCVTGDRPPYWVDREAMCTSYRFYIMCNALCVSG